jgi:hypothetical protein
MASPGSNVMLHSADHVAGIGVLSQLTIEAQLHFQILRVADFVLGREPRSNGQEVSKLLPSRITGTKLGCDLELPHDLCNGRH